MENQNQNITNQFTSQIVGSTDHTEHVCINKKNVTESESVHSVNSTKSTSSSGKKGKNHNNNGSHTVNTNTKSSHSKSSSNHQKTNNRYGNTGNHGSRYNNHDIDNDSPIYGLNKNRTVAKKTNLNHLLNFKFESRDTEENYYEYEKSTKQFWSTKLTKCSVFNKEQFLQANCQFVVRNTGDYTIHMIDPDRLVDWDKIEEIRIETIESIACPICLYEPVCGKMTKCGHIYCWSCILHYLSLSDKSWRKCPICFESIYKNDLKSVKVLKHLNEYQIGDEIKMNLMFRFKTKYSTIILPACYYDEFTHDEMTSKQITFNLFNTQKYLDCKQYFKIHSKSAADIHDDIIRREKDELDKQYEAEKTQSEVCFVQEAINLLKEREDNLMKDIHCEEYKHNKEKKIKKQDMSHELSYEDAFEEKLTIKENKFESKKIDTESKIELNEEHKQIAINPESLTKLADLQNINDISLFYQSSDGQRIYINGLNNRCLIQEYSTLNKCPLELNAKIIAFDSLFMTEENRKRHKYLGHLPLHSEFKLVELDLKEPVLSQKTLDLFQNEISERKKVREQKKIREKRDADRIAALVEQTPHYYVQSAMDEKPASFIKSSLIEPVIDYETEFPEASSSPPVSSGASVGEVSSISTTSSTGGVGSEYKSFAQMLKVSNETNLVTNVSKNAWPSLDSSTSVIGTSTQLTSGWVSMAKKQQQQQSMTGKAKRYQNPPSPWGLKTSLNDNKTNDEDQNSLEDMPAPLYKQSFFSAIDESLKIIESKKTILNINDNLGLVATNEVSEPSKEEKISNKKKKRTKQLLFST